MKNQMKTNLAIRSSLALGLALTVWAPVYAQSPQPAEGKAMTEATMMDDCAGFQYRQADARLNKVYRKAMQYMKDDQTRAETKSDQRQVEYEKTAIAS